MSRAGLAYTGYMLFFIVFVGLILITPLLAFEHDVDTLYSVFSTTCHQKMSRSLCLFSGSEGYWIADCTTQTGEFVTERVDRTLIRVESRDGIGYKMPVCARDIGLYAAMLLGGIAYPLARRIEDRELYPAIFLVIALIPIGLDGGVQLVSEIGLLPFVYESTNTIRLFTGAIAGFAASFYAIPLLVNMASKD